MSKIDVRLQYQKDTGNSLDYINQVRSRTTGSLTITCPDCGCEFKDDPELDEDLIPYIDWLEETIECLQRGIDAWESANTIATAAHKAVNKQK